jgi:hypothetical protein
MKLTAYSKLITMSKVAVDKALAPVRARSQKKKAELEVLKLEEAVTKIEQEVTELCSNQELDFNKIIDKLDEQELAQRRREQFEEVIKQLFPDVV